MADVLNFKCPCCAAKLAFSGATGEMTCEYCGASFTMEQAKAAQEAEMNEASSSDMTWTTSAPSIIKDDEGKVTGFLCQTCGAEMVADEKTAATECPYCGNFAIIPQSFDGMYRPDLVLPFAVEKEKAKEALKGFTKGKKLLPDAFTKNNRIEDITGLYVPFWLYSCHANGEMSFDGVKCKRWEDSQFRYEQKDHYNIVRSGDLEFEKIPVDASSQMDDATMDSLEPYDLTKAVAYDAAYFSGYLASRYDVEEKDARPRANERVTNTMKSVLTDQVKDYEDVYARTDNIKLRDAKAEYAMLPVWMMSTRYEDQVYTFGINGQSGKLVGSLPIDKGKYNKYLTLGTLIPFIIIMILVLLFGSLSLGWTVGALVISLLIGFIYVSILKSEMNTIAAKHTAAEYIKQGSFRPGPGKDVFAYTKTEKTPKK